MHIFLHQHNGCPRKKKAEFGESEIIRNQYKWWWNAVPRKIYQVEFKSTLDDSKPCKTETIWVPSQPSQLNPDMNSPPREYSHSSIWAIVNNQNTTLLFRRELLAKIRLEYELWCPLAESFAHSPWNCPEAAEVVPLQNVRNGFAPYRHYSTVCTEKR